MIKHCFDAIDASKYKYPEEAAFAFFRVHPDDGIVIIVHDYDDNRIFAAYGFDFIDNTFFNDCIEIEKQATFYKRKISGFQLINNDLQLAQIKNISNQLIRNINDAKAIKDLL